MFPPVFFGVFLLFVGVFLCFGGVRFFFFRALARFFWVFFSVLLELFFALSQAKPRISALASCVLLPVRYPRPPDARAFPLPVPAACPCPYSSVCSVALLHLRHHATSRVRHGARSHERARGPRAASF